MAQSRVSKKAVKDAENTWLGIMTSRQYQPELVEFILKHGKKRDLQYLGTYFISPEHNLADPFVKEGKEDIHFDIIYPNEESLDELSEDYGKLQTFIYGYDQLFTNRFPSKGKTGIYLVGELHESIPQMEEDREIHWNLLEINTVKKTICFFDPAIDVNHYQRVLSGHELYAFDSREPIVESIQKLLGNYRYDAECYMPRYRPQWVCAGGKADVDLFCQTWILFFLDVIANEITDQFLQINFSKHRTAVVKSWAICIIKKIGKITKDKEWKIFANYQELKYFPYCIIKRKSSVYMIEPIECRDVSDNCAVDVVKMFS